MVVEVVAGQFVHTIPQPTPPPLLLHNEPSPISPFPLPCICIWCTSTSNPWLEPTVDWCQCQCRWWAPHQRWYPLSIANGYCQKPTWMQTSHCSMVVCLSSYPQWLVCQPLHTASPTFLSCKTRTKRNSGQKERAVPQRYYHHLKKWMTMPNNVHQTTLFAFCTTEHTQHNHLAVPSAYPYGLVIVSQPLMIIIMLPALLCWITSPIIHLQLAWSNSKSHNRGYTIALVWLFLCSSTGPLQFQPLCLTLLSLLPCCHCCHCHCVMTTQVKGDRGARQWLG